MSLYVGNDTGFSHYASLIVSKIVIIMGGGTFERFFPWPSSSNQYIIYNKLECFDCTWSCKYKERYCLKLIKPSDVFSFIEQVLIGNINNHSLDLKKPLENEELLSFCNPGTRKLYIKKVLKKIII